MRVDRERLMGIFDGMEPSRRDIAEGLIDELAFLEAKLDEVRGMPFLLVNGKGEQKASPAARLYKDCLAQKSNIVRILLLMTRNDSDGEKESPLRAYLKSLGGMDSGAD